MLNSRVVSARINNNSHPAKAAVAAAVRAKSRLVHAVRFLHQISKCIAASVRHADATMDQMIVIQLMFRFSQGVAPDSEEFVFPYVCAQ